MDETLTTAPKFLADASYLPRVTRHDGLVLEEALAGATLFDQGAQLVGAIAEATYAAEDPPILRRLRDASIPFLIEPQTLRFTGEAFLEIETFSNLPYAPSGAITLEGAQALNAAAFAREVLEFQQEHGSAAYISPALPLYDRDEAHWVEQNQRLLQATCDANGSGNVERRPLLAQVAPGRKAVASPDAVIESMMDLPVDGVYVQPLRLNPVRDSVEKLFRYVEMLEALEGAGLPTVAARVGAFGLVLSALGISSFDSGLGQAEASDLASLNRKPTERERTRDGARGARRVYLQPLKTTLQAKHAEMIIRDPSLRSQFVCNLGCCRFQEFEELPNRGRHHYLWARNDEVATLRQLPSPSLRRDFVHEELRNAREVGRLVRRRLIRHLRDLPSFEHVDRWIRVLAREKEARAAA